MTKILINRHIVKTISYRIISSTIGFLILWGTTGNIKIGASFSLAELLFKPFIYFLHERGWYKYIKYGVIQEKKECCIKLKPKKLIEEEMVKPTPPPTKMLREGENPEKIIKRLNYSRRDL